MASDADPERAGRPADDGDGDQRADVYGALLVSLAAFVFYVFAVAPAPHLLDSAELASASFSLGIAHPPGEPLALVWGKLWAMLPVGSIAFRVGLSQAVAGAAAAGLVFLLGLWIAERFDVDRRVDGQVLRILAAAAALAFAFAPGVAQAAVRPEVYASATALAIAALWLALCTRGSSDRGRDLDARPALAAALLIGLGVANHPLIAATVGVGAVLAAFPLLRAGSGISRARLVAGSIAAVLVGAAVVTYLPVRGGAIFAGRGAGLGDTIVWGDPRTWSGLWWILSARTFLDKAAVVHRSEDPGSLPFLFMEEVSLLGLLLAAAGVYALFRRNITRAPALALLVSVLGAVAAALVGGLDPGNPDIRGYLGGAIAVTTTFAVTGALFGLMIVRDRRVQKAVAAVFLLLSIGRGIGAVSTVSLRGVIGADRIASETLSSMPPHAALFTAHFETAFLLSYARAVEGRRPDVAWAHLGFARGPGNFERLSRAQPDLAPVLRAYLAAPLALAPIRELRVRRPVRIEPPADLAPDLASALRPAEMAWAFDEAGPSRSDVPPSLAGLDAGTAAQAWREAESQPEIRNYLSWRLYLDAQLACATGRPEAAAYLSLLTARLPHDTLALSLRARCPVH